MALLQRIHSAFHVWSSLLLIGVLLVAPRLSLGADSSSERPETSTTNAGTVVAVEHLRPVSAHHSGIVRVTFRVAAGSDFADLTISQWDLLWKDREVFRIGQSWKLQTFSSEAGLRVVPIGALNGDSSLTTLEEANSSPTTRSLRTVGR